MNFVISIVGWKMWYLVVYIGEYLGLVEVRKVAC